MLAMAEFWVAIAFVAFLVILVYYKVPGLIAKALDARAEAIRKELDEARRLREEAQKLLAAGDASEDGVRLDLPKPWLDWLEQVHSGVAQAKAPMKASLLRNDELRLQYMGKLGPNEFLLRLARESSVESPKEFATEFGLTSRESEVLAWLSKGKTNRDIAQILGLSPRTVDKHLEQIYAKLGVENRTAAAAVATNASRQRS